MFFYNGGGSPVGPSFALQNDLDRRFDNCKDPPGDPARICRAIGIAIARGDYFEQTIRTVRAGVSIPAAR